MPIKYVPFIPEPVEGQAVLGNFNRILRYKGADDVSMTLQRGMPLYEMEKQETVGENSDGNMVIRGECVSACAYLKEQGIQVDLVYIDPPFASGADYAKKVYIRRNPKVAEVIAQAEQKGLLRGESSIVQLPTGVGKTRSIELIIRAAFLSERANIAIIVAPLRALCNEITMDMYKASLIEEWIVQNELTEKIYTETELLYVITELYLQICGDFRYQEHIQSICKKWIDGQTPMEINNKETIGIAEVESLCNKRISYEMNFLIGNICDLIEVDGENEEQVDQRNILTLLQKKVKYGVPNMTAISICESVFNDRLLAIELAQILSDANIGTDKILNMLKAHSEEIFSCLDSYPEYFKDRLSVLMK